VDEQRVAPGSRRRVAVVGSGVSGLTAAWVMQRSADVTLYEADARLGGHADTHDVTGRGGPALAVDTGFIVHNERTYPTLLRLFSELGVATQDSDMSMSVHCDGCGLEYAGARGVGGLLASRTAASPRYLRMLGEVVRFHRRARALLASPDDGGTDTTLDEFLAAGSFSRYFVDHFMHPMVSAVWSSAPATSGRYPARYLFAFLANHGMLSVTGSPPWRTVVGGSRSYVERVGKELTAVRTSTPVRALRRAGDGVEVRDEAGEVLRYDAAVVATHPDQALRLLTEPTAAEREVLGAFKYSRNETLLHTDSTLLPRAPRAHASWNYRIEGCHATASGSSGTSASPADGVLVSYDMTRLQRLPTGDDRFIVTLGGAARIRPESVLARMSYEHPTYTPESIAAQRRLPELSGSSLAYAGAYHGWGFHEDGALSGVRAAAALGATW